MMNIPFIFLQNPSVHNPWYHCFIVYFSIKGNDAAAAGTRS
jgi:hypothetical protein